MAKKKIQVQQDFILLDRSGSMNMRWNDTIGGINAYVAQLAKDKETSGVLVTVATFDSNPTLTFDLVRQDIPADKWKDISVAEVAPRGGTPLLDAVTKLVALAEAAAPDKSAIIIVTDGEENSSREATKDAVKAALDRCRAKGWQVLFLGADFDNFHQASGLGNAPGQTISSNSANLVGTFAATATMRSAYASTGAQMNYSAEDKKRAKV